MQISRSRLFLSASACFVIFHFFFSTVYCFLRLTTLQWTVFFFCQALENQSQHSLSSVERWSLFCDFRSFQGGGGGEGLENETNVIRINSQATANFCDGPLKHTFGSSLEYAAWRFFETFPRAALQCLSLLSLLSKTLISDSCFSCDRPASRHGTSVLWSSLWELVR